MRSAVAIAITGLVVACSLAALAATDKPASVTTGQLSRGEMILESSKLTDLNVHNDQEVKLGSIDNLIIDAHTGQVLYGVLDTGLGGKHIPVPWTALRLSKAADKDTFSYMLNMSKDQLANAPTYDSDHRPNFTDEQWRQSVNRFFGVRTVARPMQQD